MSFIKRKIAQARVQLTVQHYKPLQCRKMVSTPFRAAIEQTLSSIKHGKARLAVVGPKAAAVEQIVSEITNTPPKKGFVDIIVHYVTEDIGRYELEPDELERRIETRTRTKPAIHGVNKSESAWHAQ